MPVFRTRTVNGAPKLYLNESGNDLWIRETVFPNKRNGYFVEAGAADGVTGSSCYFLEKYFGWRGICIEPNDDLFAQLVKTRSNSILVDACLANQSGWEDFAVPSTGIGPYFGGVRRVLADAWHGHRVLPSATIVSKRSTTLAELLRVHQAPKEIEYGAFDMEGSEFEALRSFPFDACRFLAISCEVSPVTCGPLTRLLAGQGYLQTLNPFNQHCPWERYWLHESIANGHVPV